MVTVRIDRPDDGDAPDRPVNEPTPRTSDKPAAPDPPDPGDQRQASAPDPPDGGSPLRQQRARDYRATADAIYDARSAHRPADRDQARAIDEGCARVERIERETVTPAMRRIEAEDPDRRLAGLENRLKGKDRLTEKVLKAVNERGRSVEEAFGLVKDVIRYTFCYPDDRYTSGVDADCDRLQGAGFEWIDRENSWTQEQYKGINSRWRVPGDGQIFEVQFHTKASLEAKEITHPAYEKLRIGVPTNVEQRELEDFQKRITAQVPIPPGAADVADYHLGERDADQDHLLRDGRRPQQ
jgi:hypothetical protein